MSVFEVKGLRVSLGGKAVVDGATFAIETGVTMLLGRNGCGKSTLIKALLGLIPSKGEILLDGQDLRGMSVRQRARLLAYLPQRQTIPPGTTLLDYVAMGASPAAALLASPGTAERRAALSELEKLNMAIMQGRMLDTLSGGEARLAALARTRMQKCRLTLMDEPLAGLDFFRQHEFMAHARAYKTPILMSLHDPTFAWQYADRLLIMENGSIVSCEKNDEACFSGIMTRIFGANLQFEDAGGQRLPIWNPDTTEGIMK